MTSNEAWQIMQRIALLERRSRFVTERLCAGAAAADPAYHRWAAMYAKRRRAANLRLAHTLKPLTKKMAIDDLNAICEMIPMVGLASILGTSANEVYRWMRSGPPMWRYEPINNIRKRLDDAARKGSLDMRAVDSAAG
jgi:hypothetical protein